MSNDELIKLPRELSTHVALQLRMYGIDKWEKYESLVDCRFTQAELMLIEELDIKNPINGALEGIEMLPNLRRLSISGTQNAAFTDPRWLDSIGDKDVWHIQNLKNLESLTIINQSHITEIDLSLLPQLKEVNINNNVNLEEIVGIDKLKKLESLSCYGNASLQNIRNLDKTIIQNKDNLSGMNLDVLLFPKAIGYKPIIGEYNKEAMEAIEYIDETSSRGVTWTETVNLANNFTMGMRGMLNLHNTACRILHDILPPNAGTCVTVTLVEKYLAENVIYDAEANKFTGPNGIICQIGPEHVIRGAVGCLVWKSCVCQGYTRGEQYLLALRGIKTREVYCFAGKDTFGFSDPEYVKKHTVVIPKLPQEGRHSIIRIDDYYSLYSDPCWNACDYQAGCKSMPYTLLTKEEMSKDHILSFLEADVENSTAKIERSLIAKCVEENTLFRNARASDVYSQRAALQQDVKGIVRGADDRTY